MGKYQFVMDTSNYCFLCVSKPTHTNSKSIEEMESGNVSQQQTEKSNVSTPYSFRRILKYLKTDLKEIFGEVTPLPSSALPVLEQSDIRGVICPDCALICENFSNQFLKLEEIQMKLQLSLKSIHDRMIVLKDDTNRDHVLNEFEEEMLSRPETLLHYGIVERLRTKILEQCSKISGILQYPKVLLPRIANFVPNQQSIVEDDEIICKPISSDVPKITSVIGNHQNSPHLDMDTDSKSISCPAPESDEAVVSRKMAQNVEIISDSAVNWKTVGKSFINNSTSGKFRCHICSKEYFTRTKLQGHFKSSHTQTKYRCRLCKREFLLRGSYNRHFLSIHSQTRFSCQTCKKEFSHKGTLNQHRLTVHLLGKRYPCSLCFKMFAHSSDRNKHMKHVCQKIKLPPKKNPGNPGGIKCKYCDRTFSSRPNACRHQKICPERPLEDPLRDDARQDPTIKMITPSDANLSSKTSAKGYAKHFLRNNETGEITCNLCDKTFSSYSASVHHHYKSAHLKLRFRCEQCNAVLTSLKSLRTHQQTIHEGKRFPCKYCPKTFSQPSTLNAHVKLKCQGRDSKLEENVTVSAPLKPLKFTRSYECSICHNFFGAAKERWKHQLKDHNGKRVACSYCSRTFTTPSNKYVHLKRCPNRPRGNPDTDDMAKQNPDTGPGVVEELKCRNEKVNLQHKMDSNSEVSPPPNKTADTGWWKCSHCSDYEFRTEKELDGHYKTVHEKLKFACYFCEKRFAHKVSLIRHRLKVHPGQQAQCKYCWRSFDDPDNLIYHVEFCCPRRIGMDATSNPTNHQTGPFAESEAGNSVGEGINVKEENVSVT